MTEDKSENYGLDKPLSLWNVYQVKRPQDHGGFHKFIFVTIVIVSFLGPGFIIGLALFLATRPSKFLIRRMQGNVFLLVVVLALAIWWFIFFQMYGSVAPQGMERCCFM